MWDCVYVGPNNRSGLAVTRGGGVWGGGCCHTLYSHTKSFPLDTHTHTHTHIYMCVYVYVRVCVCVCVCVCVYA